MRGRDRDGRLYFVVGAWRVGWGEGKKKLGAGGKRMNGLYVDGGIEDVRLEGT